MTTYHIAAEPQFTLGKRAISELGRTGFFLLLYTAVWRVAEGRWLHVALLAILGTVLFLGNLLTSFLWPRKTPSYDVEIDNNGIRLTWNRKVRREVRKERVRYVAEWGSGISRKLVVSERGPMFTRWLWGGISIPASLAGYDEIKTQAFDLLQNPKA
jgi:hypothetical protein